MADALASSNTHTAAPPQPPPPHYQTVKLVISISYAFTVKNTCAKKGREKKSSVIRLIKKKRIEMECLEVVCFDMLIMALLQ